jgi:DNA replication protein DnaC
MEERLGDTRLAAAPTRPRDLTEYDRMPRVGQRRERCVDLIDDLHAGLADGSFAKRLRAWSSPALRIIDDVGLGQVRKRDEEPTGAHTLFNLIDRRHGRVSTALTSNIDLSHWGKYLGDATVAMAILDRLAMHGIRIDIDGPSYRQHVGAERAEKLGKRNPST